MLQKSESVKQDNVFFNKMMKSLTDEDSVNQDFVDPIYMTIMKNPVVLSSGVVLDLSTASKFNDKNRIQFETCPFTN